LHAARALNAYVRPEHIVPGHPAPATTRAEAQRPGNQFNARADWHAILEPHGWRCVGHRGQTGYWRRPGRTEPGWSATTNFAGRGFLYVFSTNAAPFDPDTAYTPFAAYALLQHRGDFTAAAKALAAQGYGASAPQLEDWRAARARHRRREAEAIARRILARRQGATDG